METHFRLLIALVLMPILAFGQVETLTINSGTRDVLNAGNVNFATGKLLINGVAVTTGGGGAGAVSSVFGRTGDVVATVNDYTFAQIGSKPTTLAGYGITDAQPLDSDLTAIAALSTTSFGRGTLALADGPAFRTYIGAGTSNFDGTFSSLTGKPTTLAGYGITDAQSLDSDLTAIAGLTTTSFGRGSLTQVDAAGFRSYIGAGTGTGTVTNFSAGDLSPLFTTTETTTTTTPALAFTLSAAGANTWFGNATASSTSPSYNSAGAFTEVDDTNVTLVLGGTPGSAGLKSVSFTLGWAGSLAIARGGTGQTSAPSVGAILRGSSSTTSSWITPVTAQSTPSNPTGTTNTTGVMCGLAGSITTSASTSGKVLIIVTGYANNSAASGGVKMQIRHGTGTAPINGAALTGTADGNFVAVINSSTSGVITLPFSTQAIVSGLSAGTAYWIDLSEAAITGGTGSVVNPNISAVEL